MAAMTEPAAVSERAAPVVRLLPYRPGPISRLFGWMDAVPARPWLVLGVLTILLLIWAHVTLWWRGVIPVGTLDLAAIVLVFYIPYPLAGGIIGRRIARNAVMNFWPATGWPVGEQDSWIARFENVPMRDELVAGLIGLVVGVGAMLAVPTAVVGPDRTRLDVDLALAPMFVGGYVLSALAVAYALHWVRLVAEIHRRATAIEPFDRAPIYAFSRLTVFVGLAILAGTYYTFTVNAPFITGNLPAQTFLPITTTLSVVAFVLPLWGIHGRLVRRKDELLGDVAGQIRTAGAELKARVEAGSFEESKAIHDALAGLTIVRDQIRDLPTWPWPPQLLRGFISALLLPVIVYILSRAAAGFVSV
jgi:hypothetical protein